jgi:hypothetical protein
MQQKAGCYNEFSPGCGPPNRCCRPSPPPFCSPWKPSPCNPPLKPHKPQFLIRPLRQAPWLQRRGPAARRFGALTPLGALGKKALGLACSETARILGLPEGYRVAVVPASDTGAVEMAMWSLLGARGVDVLAWESFGSGWVTDIVKQLKLPNVNKIEAGYGDIVDLYHASTLTTTWCSPGTAPPRASRCPMATGLQRTAPG